MQLKRALIAVMELVFVFMGPGSATAFGQAEQPPQSPDADQQGTLSGLRAAIQSRQVDICELVAELATQRSLFAAQDSALQFEASQRNAMFQQQLTTLGASVQQQSLVLDQRQVDYSQVVAPDGSDYKLEIQAQVEQAQAQLDALRNQYAQVIEAQQSSMAAAVAAQGQRLRQEQDAESAINQSIAAANRELEALTGQAEDLRAAMSLRTL